MDYSNCLEIELAAEKNLCVLDKAKEFNDAQGCEFVDNFFKSDCLKALALDLSKENLCGEISSNEVKWECYSELGIKIKDSDVCFKIPLGKNNELRGTCLKETAIYEKDPVVCTKINYFSLEGEVVRDSCLDYFL